MVRSSSALVAFTMFVAVAGVIGLFGFAGAARADVPPITAVPPAGETAPPADAITNPSACGGWYRQSNYGGLWATDSTWWEYSCSYIWPGYGTGATNADWWGQYTWTDYFYWDGSKPIRYGENFYDGYSDGWIMATFACYWYDAASGWSGVITCD